MKTRRIGFAAMIFIASPSMAAVVITNDAEPSTYEIRGKARNGRSGFEGILETQGGNPTMNPTGTPVWAFGENYNFRLTYDSALGSSDWGIDFNRDGDFDDASELVSVIELSKVGFGFNYVNLWIQGNASSAVTVSNFTVNGSSFGPFSAGGNDTATSTLFKNTNGVFSNVEATGTFSFSANGGSDERPRLWARLGGLSPLSAVPEPSTWMMLILGFGLIGASLRAEKLRQRTKVAVSYN